MARKGSADRSIPHTRIMDESGVWETYTCGEKIGQGTFGKVFKVQHKESGQYWAMKVINKEKAGGPAIKLIEREVTILKRVQHENIITLNEVFETGKKMYLIMELCEGGELADAVKEKGSYSEEDCKTIMRKLASAISYLHKKDIVHRDLKLENILLSVNPENPSDHLHLKVTDFGLSVVKGGVGHDNMMQDFCGTPIYMSPEIIDNKTYSQQCDVWAMGVIMYILMCGAPPFKSKDEDSLYEIIKKAEVDFSDEAWASVSENAKHCIQQLLKSDPAHRITASEVLHHPWITGVDDAPATTNVLEMMKLFRNEQENSAINGEVEKMSLEEESTSDGPSDDKKGEGRKGSGTKKPGSGGRSGASSRANNVSSNKTSASASKGSNSSSTSKSYSVNKGQTNNKVSSTVTKTNTGAGRGRGPRK